MSSTGVPSHMYSVDQRRIKKYDGGMVAFQLDGEGLRRRTLSAR